MKKISTLFLIFYVSLTFGQNNLFKEKSVFLKTNASSWSHIYTPFNINNDGIPDFIGQESQASIILISNSEMQNYKKDTIRLNSFRIHFNSYQDLDGDGYKDILTFTDTYYKNDGNNHFIKKDFFIGTYAGFHFPIINDFDEDGKLDFFTLTRNYYGASKSYFLFSNGWEDFEKIVVDIDTATYGAAKLIDINNDNKKDIVVLKRHEAENYVYTYYLITLINNGDRSFSKEILPLDFEVNIDFLDIVDLDNDNDLDILLLDRFGRINIKENTGNNYKDEVELSARRYRYIKNADLDDDGDLDIVCFDYSFSPNKIVSVYYLLNEGNLKFSKRVKVGEVTGFSSISGGEGYDYFHLLDLNNDNLIDILLNAPKDSSLVWFENKTIKIIPTEIKVHPESTVGCINDSIVLEIDAIGTNLKYQWQKDEIDIPNSDSSVYIINDFSLSLAGHYRCIVKGLGGEVISKVADVTVEDEPPVITSIIENDTIFLNSECEATMPNYIDEVIAKDNCDNELLISQNPSPGSSINDDSTFVTLVVTDNANNSSTKQFIVFVNDTISPVIECIEDTTRIAESNNYYLVKGDELDLNIISDNCDFSSVTNNFNDSSTLEGVYLPVGETNIIWTVQDFYGNKSQCSFDITVSPYTNTNTLDLNKIEIFPNPTNDNIYIKSNDYKINKVVIFNYLGVKIMEVNSITNNTSINLSTFNEGMYIIEIQSIESYIRSKFIKN